MVDSPQEMLDDGPLLNICDGICRLVGVTESEDREDSCKYAAHPEHKHASYPNIQITTELGRLIQ